MKIIAIKGRGCCGKSETLGIHLRRILKERSGIPYQECWKDTRESIKTNDKVIDICPPGDNVDEVIANISFIEKHPCDVVFTATRTRGGSWNTLKEYAARRSAELIEVWKHYDDNLDKEGQTKANKKLAEELLKKI